MTDGAQCLKGKLLEDALKSFAAFINNMVSAKAPVESDMDGGKWHGK